MFFMPSIRRTPSPLRLPPFLGQTSGSSKVFPPARLACPVLCRGGLSSAPSRQSPAFPFFPSIGLIAPSLPIGLFASRDLQRLRPLRSLSRLRVRPARSLPAHFPARTTGKGRFPRRLSSPQIRLVRSLKDGRRIQAMAAPASGIGEPPASGKTAFSGALRNALRPLPIRYAFLPSPINSTIFCCSNHVRR